jgi:hypothetical protein
MSRALTCAICRLRKHVGIMSGQAWGVVNGESATMHACPDCQQKHLDWREQLTRLADTA